MFFNEGKYKNEKKVKEAMHRVMKALQFKKCIAPSSLSTSPNFHNFHNCQSLRIFFFISKHPNKIFVSFFFFNVINIY